jgi:dimethylglycine dehydrogenase
MPMPPGSSRYGRPNNGSVFVTSGAYGHCVDASLALAYLDREFAVPGTEVDVHIVGVKRRARVANGPFFDPNGSRMRA